MTAAQLAELNGLLALAVDRRTDRAEGRDPEAAADLILAEIAAPDLASAIGKLTMLIR